MTKQSAGLLIYREKNGQIEVFLVHPVGPFWAKKDLKAWSIPKGEFNSGEAKLAVAKREFTEETGQTAPDVKAHNLGSIKQPGGKEVFAWALKGEVDETKIKSNQFEIEWPPKSGQRQSFPEVDKAGWFDLKTAADKLHPGQEQLLIRLATHLKVKFDLPSDNSDSQLTDTQVKLL